MVKCPHCLYRRAYRNIGTAALSGDSDCTTLECPVLRKNYGSDRRIESAPSNRSASPRPARSHHDHASFHSPTRLLSRDAAPPTPIMSSPSQLSLVGSALLEAPLTGILWGIGHSLTLLVVGGAIIFFSIVIPERLGVSLEFCVALMLVLLRRRESPVAMRSMRVDRFSRRRHEHVHRCTAITCTRHAHGHDREPRSHVRIQCLPRVGPHLRSREMVSRDPTNHHWRRARPPLVRPPSRSALPIIPATDVGPQAPHRFWPQHRHGHDADDGETIAVPIAYTARFSFLNRHFRTAQVCAKPGIRSVSGVSNWIRRRSLHALTFLVSP